MSKRNLIGAIIFLFSMGTYLRTLCPTVYWDDSGELITACFLLGIAHPPGYPLYLLLGKLFTFIPFGSIAFRLNLMSAFFGALTVNLLYLIVLKISTGGRRQATGSEYISAIVAALMLGFCSTFWAQSVVARVYTLNAFLMTSLILIMLEWRQSSSIGSQSLLYLFAVVCGMGLGNHLALGICIPAGVFIILMKGRRFLPKPMNLFFMGMLFLLGLLIYLYLPLRSRQNPPLDWGNPQTMENFIYVITRGGYWYKVFVKSSFQALKAISTLFRSFPGEFTWAGCLLAAAGIGYTVAKDRVLGAGLLIIVIGNLASMILHGSHYDIFQTNRYFIPTYIAFSLWIGWGVRAVANTILNVKLGGRRRSIRYLLLTCLLLIPILPLLRHYADNDRSRNWLAYDYGMNILNSLPPQAILFTKGDNSSFPLWYLQHVEGERKDIVHFDYPPFSGLPYIRENRSDVSFSSPAKLIEIAEDKTINMIVNSNLGTHPIYFTGLDLEDEDFLVPNGILFKVEGERTRLIQPGTLDRHQLLWEAYRLPKEPMAKGSEEEWLLHEYARFRSRLGDYFYRRGTDEEAVREYREAIRLAPRCPFGYFSLGVYLYRKGGVKEALSQYMKAIEVDPQCADAYYNIGFHFHEIGDRQRATDYFRKAVRVDPGHFRAHYNLAFCLSEEGKLKEAVKEYERAIRLKPDFAEARNNLGNAYMKKGRVSQAISQYRKALEIESDYVEAHINLGVAYHNQGLREKAITEFERVLELDPDNEVAQENLEAVSGDI